MCQRESCDPTWNYVPRTLALYVLPLFLWALLFYGDFPRFDRNFWIPFLFATLVPPWNIHKKRWAFKDFQGRDSFPWTIPLIFSGVWLFALEVMPFLWLSCLTFIALFLAFDIFLLKYEILKIYTLPVDKLKKNPLERFTAVGTAWWSYLAIAFLLVHLYGDNHPLSIITSLILMVLPLQLTLEVMKYLFAKEERLTHIRKVAVIGAGFSGIYTTKWLTEMGIEAECFEKKAFPGGVWQFDAKEEVKATVARNTRATSSKHFMHAMDFKVNGEYPEFPDREHYMSFLKNYMDHFRIREKITLNTTVKTAVKKGEKWSLTLCGEEGERQRDFDAVVVCSGPQGIARLDVSHDPLYGAFAGKILHASQYKDNSQIEKDERVLIVGAGESSADIVSECAQKSRNVCWTVHRGQWFADRNVGPFAADHIVALGIRQFLGKFFNCEYLVRRFIGININIIWGVGGHGIIPWRPKAPYLHQFVNKSRDGILELYKGRVTAKGAVEKVEGKGVRFCHDDEFMEFDKIILATGFKPHWPFLDAPPCELYKTVFAPQDSTLSFVGLARPVIGSITSLAEIQARWIATFYSGGISLPHPVMRESILHEELKDKKMRFLDSSRLKVLTDQADYANELAGYMGIDPPWFKLLFTDPRSFFLLLRSPWTAFQFQLRGGKEARERALKCIEEELPHMDHPVHRMFNLLLSVAVGVISLTVLLFAFFPLWQVCFWGGVFLTAISFYHRWKEKMW